MNKDATRCKPSHTAIVSKSSFPGSCRTSLWNSLHSSSRWTGSNGNVVPMALQTYLPCHTQRVHFKVTQWHKVPLEGEGDACIRRRAGKIVLYGIT